MLVGYSLLAIPPSLPEDLQIQMLEAAAKEPDTEVFAQILQVTVLGGGHGYIGYWDKPNCLIDIVN